MNNEPEKIGNDAEWSMPEPIYRSSEGKDLRASSQEAADGGNDSGLQNEGEIIMENESEGVNEATTDLQGETAVEKEAKGDKLGMSMTAVGLVALLGAGIIFLLFYFLFFRQAASGTP